MRVDSIIYQAKYKADPSEKRAVNAVVADAKAAAAKAPDASEGLCTRICRIVSKILSYFGPDTTPRAPSSRNDDELPIYRKIRLEQKAADAAQFYL